MKKYESMTDEQLLRKLREGEVEIADYIIKKYKNLVKRKARAMYLLGGESEDLIQEGMIGLFKAIRDYDVEQEKSFLGFADMCISRQLYTAIKLSQRQKHIPLNFYVSLYEEKEDINEEKMQQLIEVIRPEKDYNPEGLFLDKEYFEMMEQKIAERLSVLEKEVFHYHLLGEDYRSIAEKLGKSPKAIDNALQRVKRKINDILE